MSRKTQPEKSHLADRLLKFMDDGDVIILAKLGDKVYSNFVQVDKVSPEISMELFRRAGEDLINRGKTFLNLLDSHDDNA